MKKFCQSVVRMLVIDTIMNSPLISVITITYNAEDSLPYTLKSVSEQTFRDFEHLIIDGASKDSTVSLARHAGYPEIKIYSEPDEGLYFAMNKGLRQAKGKYVIFLNSGDSFHSPEVLGRYAMAAAEDPDIIYGDTEIVNEKREFVSPRHLSAPDILTFKSFAEGMLICHQAFMVKRDIAPEFNTVYRFSADYDWTIECIKASENKHFINLHSVVIDYLADGLTDKNKYSSLLERYRIMARHYGSVPTFFRHISFTGRLVKRKLFR